MAPTLAFLELSDYAALTIVVFLVCATTLDVARRRHVLRKMKNGANAAPKKNGSGLSASLKPEFKDMEKDADEETHY